MPSHINDHTDDGLLSRAIIEMHQKIEELSARFRAHDDLHAKVDALAASHQGIHEKLDAAVEERDALREKADAMAQPDHGELHEKLDLTIAKLNTLIDRDRADDAKVAPKGQTKQRGED